MHDQLACIQACLARFKATANPRVLDLRSREAFNSRRLTCSHNIPQAELPQRLFELPPKDSPKPLAVLVPEAAARLPVQGNEAELQLPDWLAHHGWRYDEALPDCEALWQQAAALGLLERCEEQAMHHTLLFEPCPLLKDHIMHIEAALPPDRWTCLDVGAHHLLHVWPHHLASNMAWHASSGMR